MHSRLVLATLVGAASLVAASCKRQPARNAAVRNMTDPVDSIPEDPVFQFCSVQAALEFPPPGQRCSSDLDVAEVQEFCGDTPGCDKGAILRNCLDVFTSAASDGPAPRDAVALTDDTNTNGMMAVKRQLFTAACFGLVKDGTKEAQSGTATTNAPSPTTAPDDQTSLRLVDLTPAQQMIYDTLMLPLRRMFKTEIPQSLVDNVKRLFAAQTRGVGAGIGGSATAIVGRSLALELLAEPSTTFADETTVGLYCSTGLGISPGVEAGISGYAIKTLGCQNHGDYMGDSISASLGVGVPVGVAAVGGSVGIGLAVDLRALYNGMKANARAVALDFAVNGAQHTALIDFLVDYVKNIPEDRTQRILKSFAATFAGGLLSDIILQGPALAAKNVARDAGSGRGSPPAGLAKVTADADKILAALADAAETINEKKLLKEAITGLVDAMKAYQTRNNNTALASPIAILGVVADTVGCGSVTVAVNGSVGVGTKEEASIGVGAAMTNGSLLGEIRVAEIARLAGEVDTATAGYRRALATLDKARSGLGAAVSVQSEIDTVRGKIDECLRKAGDLSVFINRLTPFTTDEFNRRAGEVAATPGCLALAGAIAGVTSLSTVYDRAGAALNAVTTAKEGVNQASAAANEFLRSSTGAARLIAETLAGGFRDLPNAATRCAVNSFSVPFAATILDEAGVSLKVTN